jgi:hypothetical protein
MAELETTFLEGKLINKINISLCLYIYIHRSSSLLSMGSLCDGV